MSSKDDNQLFEVNPSPKKSWAWWLIWYPEERGTHSISETKLYVSKSSCRGKTFQTAFSTS